MGTLRFAHPTPYAHHTPVIRFAAIGFAYLLACVFEHGLRFLGIWPWVLYSLACGMEYRRLYRSGGRYFFTVVTENRNPLLIDHIQRLRDAFRWGLSRHPFAIEAIVVLPDHLHTLWKLPEGDADFSKRWMVIKRKFSSGLPIGAVSASKVKKREKGI
jgi:REP element-mobilizing transposase RayT